MTATCPLPEAVTGRCKIERIGNESLAIALCTAAAANTTIRAELHVYWSLHLYYNVLQGGPKSEPQMLYT